MENGGIDAARVAVQSQQQQHLGLLFSIFVQSGIPSDLLQTTTVSTIWALPACREWMAVQTLHSKPAVAGICIATRTFFVSCH